MTRRATIEEQRLWAETEIQRLAARYPGYYGGILKRYFETHSERIAHLLSSLESASPDRAGRLLDIGSFPGHVTLLLKRRGWNVTALSQPLGSDVPGGDAFMQALEAEEIPLVETDIERQFAPLDDGAFDNVLFTEVIEHLAHNPFHALAEICRLLGDDGRIWLSTPNLASGRNLFRLWRGRTIHGPLQALWQETFPNVRGLKHEREYTAGELRYFLSPAERFAYRFEAVQVSAHNWAGVEAAPQGPWRRGLESLATAIFPRLGSTLFARAAKPGTLRVCAPSSWRFEGDWSEPTDPLEYVRPPAVAPYPYPFRSLRSEGDISFDFPSGFVGKGRKVSLRLPWIWHMTEPRLPEQTIHIEQIDGQSFDPISSLTVRPGGDVQILTIDLGTMPSSAPRTLRLRFRSENPVCPDDIFHNGDRELTGPAVAMAHWAVCVD